MMNDDLNPRSHRTRRVRGSTRPLWPLAYYFPRVSAPENQTNYFSFDATRSVWTFTIFNISLIWRVDALDVNGALVQTVVWEDGVNARSDRGGNKKGTEFWGYVDVRPGAHMFYWLYHSYHAEGYSNRPLIIWLQVSDL